MYQQIVTAKIGKVSPKRDERLKWTVGAMGEGAATDE